MTGEPAMARAALVTSGSQRTWLFVVTVTGSLVMLGSIALAPVRSRIGAVPQARHKQRSGPVVTGQQGSA